MAGPLTGVRVIELAGIGPGPFAAMLLADLGAEVIRVSRLGDARAAGAPRDVVLRGRRAIAVDLKSPEAKDIVCRLVGTADALIEGFRPGVAERLGLGPADCHAVNPRLVYCRMTGWGQTGPLSSVAGHDINYIALVGALDSSRRAGQRPVPPMNLLGDLGGGALFLAFGLVAALYEAKTSGLGQVVDANIVDGTASLMNFILGLRAQGRWSEPPGHNILDTGRPYYDTYACQDGGEIALGALEPQFYAELLRLVQLDDESVRFENRDDPAHWPAARQCWAETFASRPRDEWAALLSTVDTCATPVLSIDQAAANEHLQARDTYVTVDGVLQAAPAPRFSRTMAEIGRPPVSAGADTDEILTELGLDLATIATLRERRAVG